MFARANVQIGPVRRHGNGVFYRIPGFRWRLYNSVDLN